MDLSKKNHLTRDVYESFNSCNFVSKLNFVFKTSKYEGFKKSKKKKT